MAAMPKWGGDEEGVDKGIVNKGVMDGGGWDEGVGVDMRTWELGDEWCVCEGGGDQGGEIIKGKGSGKREKQYWLFSFIPVSECWGHGLQKRVWSFQQMCINFFHF